MNYYYQKTARFIIGAVALAIVSPNVSALRAQSVIYPQHFDIAEVRLTGGPMRDAMITNARLLLDYDAARLMTPFVREARLDRQGGKYEGWTEKHPSFRNWGDYSWSLEGHVGGHYISALALGYGAMRNDPGLSPLAEQLLDRMQYCLDIMKDCQDAYAADTGGMRGFIGGQPYTEMWRGLYAGDLEAFHRHGGKVPFYCQHKILAGLRDAWVYAGSRQALEMFRGLCDWSIAVVSKLDEKQMQAVLDWEHGGMNEVLADAYSLFGDRKYLDAAVRYSHRKMADGMATDGGADYNRHFLDRNHANTQVPKYIGFERICQTDPANTNGRHGNFASAARNFWDDVATNRTVCIGGNSVGEHFLPSSDCSPYMTNLEGPESCNTNNMLKLSEMLFDATHDARYADFYENALWNHILSTQDPATGGYVYFTTLRPGGYRIYSQVNEGMWCCVGTGMENHSKYAHFTYTHSADTLFVNLFMPTELNSRQFGVRQETGFPYEQGTRITVTKGGRFSMAVRRPEWAGDGYAVAVNGTAVAAETKAGYVYITRKWKAGDVVEVSLPMSVRVEECPNYTDYVAFKAGPLLLAARTTAQNESEAHRTGLEYERLQNEYADDSRMGHSPGAHAIKKSLSAAPMLIGDRGMLTKRIKPKIAALHLYTIQPDEVGKSKWPELTLEPFYGIHHARYSCYWYARTAEEYAKSPMVRADSIAAALDARTIDFVAAGEQQSEAGHLLTATAPERKGSWNSESYREIAEGQSVSYTLTNLRSGNTSPLPATGVALMCRFTRSDRGRTCSIYLDGVPLAENYVTPGDHPATDENGFFNAVFPVPERLLTDDKGNAKRSLRFSLKASDKGMAPSIFYLRLIDNE